MKTASLSSPNHASRLEKAGAAILLGGLIAIGALLIFVLGFQAVYALSLIHI